MSRLEDIDKFYYLLNELEDRLGGTRLLANCNGRMDWPDRGVYFFFEPVEFRSDGESLRVVRVGTHAVNRISSTSFWNRLRQHRGTLSGAYPGGGNHRGSVFRLQVGSAILYKEGLEEEYPTWGQGSSTNKPTRIAEYPIEKKVSTYIRSMPFLWLKADDKPGPKSIRSYIERNSIALLSNHRKLGTNKAIDPPSENWLGYHAWNENIRKSGLWNSDHTEDNYEPNFLNLLQELINKI